MQSRKTLFLALNFSLFGTLITWKMLLPSRRNTIFYKIDVFEKSTKITSKTLLKPLQNLLKIVEKTTSKTSLKQMGRSFWNIFRFFPTVSNIFQLFPIFFEKNPIIGPILSLPPQTPPRGACAQSQRDSTFALPVTWTAGEREARRKLYTSERAINVCTFIEF